MAFELVPKREWCDDDLSDDLWGDSGNDCIGHPEGIHDWREVFSAHTLSRTALQCEHCWDRTD